MKTKSIYILAFILFSLNGCTNKNSSAKPLFPNSIVGKWKLVSTYMDPGDGSGKFEPYVGPKLIPIEFNSDSTYKNNNASCIDKFSIRLKQFIKLSGNCKNSWSDRLYSYKLSPKYDSLTLYYQCIEGCGEKYVRVLNSMSLKPTICF